MFTQHNAQAAAEVYAEDAVLLVPDMPGPVKGRKAIEEYLSGFLRTFPDLSHEPKNFFSSGEWCAYEFTVRGTNTGPLELEPGHNIPPTGKRVEIPICAVMRVGADGLIREDHSYYDGAGLMGQLGLGG